MSVAYLAVWVLMMAFAASAIYGLVWAIQRGQLEGFGAGARSIFDEKEPVGVPTDTRVAGVSPPASEPANQQRRRLHPHRGGEGG